MTETAHPAAHTDTPAFAAEEARSTSWLTEAAWPLWLEHGVDWRRGAFFDKLDQTTLQNAADYKRLRVLTRQIYVFSEAVGQGWSDGRKVVDHGLSFLLERAKRHDGGFAIRFDLDGRVIDDRRDLYDLAFTLFALAHAYRATRDARLRQEAIDLVAYIERTLRHPAGGFAEGVPATLPRRQNPHMHLLEASLACVENGWGEPFAGLAGELVDLFIARFYRATEKIIPEYYDDALIPLPSDEGRFTEPGHQHEWVWLLETWTRVSALAPRRESLELYDFAVTHGAAGPDRPVRDEIWADGTIRAGSARLWPQTERLKACLALYERTGDAAHADAAAGALRVLQTYLDGGTTKGLWSEWLTGDGVWSREPVPASSLYHITIALAELRRVTEAVRPAR